ncbi:3-ketoacyl-CoA thiolase B, peroxisomal [Beauveria bassiana]|uniref:acetyl-CoA C-acyltransferase n=2 Tax=Beauveria bassiana TaxID=176275 RepID=A0A2N6NHZ6_BEABA|nr:3-ketoacyl-CoA thiolase B, peroxisomal [Beauveria bassiana]
MTLRATAELLVRSASDVVLVSALRTPVCRAYKGRLRDAYPEELLASVLAATRAALPASAPASAVEDVAVGVVLSELGGSKAARMALNHAGFPVSTTLYTVNRACASSLQAVAAVAADIRAGTISAGIAAGMESMTRNYGSRAVPQDVWPALRDSEEKNVRDCVMPMGLTSENVAERYGVSRHDQDAFAVESHRRAAAARASGAFDAEISPVRTRFQEVDKQGKPVGELQQITVTHDDGIREGVTLDALAKLKPAFTPSGASTAGNSSQVSDGAAATLLMRRDAAAALGLSGSVLGRYVAGVTVGCAPDEMGIGPALAVPKLLSRVGLETRDVHRWEVNEAFASQALHCVRALGLEDAWARGEVNPDGGAIALGHPLGATGARLVATLVHGLRRAAKGDVGVATLCIGTGMGHAALFVAERPRHGSASTVVLIKRAHQSALCVPSYVASDELAPQPDAQAKERFADSHIVAEKGVSTRFAAAARHAMTERHAPEAALETKRVRIRASVALQHDRVNGARVADGPVSGVSRKRPGLGVAGDGVPRRDEDSAEPTQRLVLDGRSQHRRHLARAERRLQLHAAAQATYLNGAPRGELDKRRAGKAYAARVAVAAHGDGGRAGCERNRRKTLFSRHISVTGGLRGRQIVKGLVQSVATGDKERAIATILEWSGVLERITYLPGVGVKKRWQIVLSPSFKKVCFFAQGH